MTNKCRNCNLEIGTDLSVAVEESLRKVGIFVCKKCFVSGRDNEYSTMTMTSAMKKYALCAQDLTGSHFSVIRKPTSYGRNSFMKLYFKFQVEEAAVNKYGTVEKALLESENAEERRAQNRINKRFGISKDSIQKEEKTRQRRRAEIENKKRQEKIATHHKHNYGEPIKINESSNLFVKRCRECKFELSWEEI